MPGKSLGTMTNGALAKELEKRSEVHQKAASKIFSRASSGQEKFNDIVKRLGQDDADVKTLDRTYQELSDAKTEARARVGSNTFDSSNQYVNSLLQSKRYKRLKEDVPTNNISSGRIESGPDSALAFTRRKTTKIKNLKKYLKEDLPSAPVHAISRGELKAIERYADRLFADLKIDIEFTKHFYDRLNDARNGKQITAEELGALFNKTHQRNGRTIAQLSDNANAILKDMRSNINIPFVFKWNRDKSGKASFELVAKTVMRKRNFLGSERKFAVEHRLDERKLMNGTPRTREWLEQRRKELEAKLGAANSTFSQKLKDEVKKATNPLLIRQSL